MHASRIALAAACAAAALGIATASAQQPAPAPPAFTASDLSPAGMPSARFTARMAAYKQGMARATVMHQLAKGFSDPEIAALADYFSKLPH